MNFLQTWGKAAQFLGAKPAASESIGDIYVSPSLRDQGVFKAYLPRYMYRPPFGYPREDNIYLIKQLAKNGYIYSITKTIKEEVANANFEIVYRKDAPLKDKLGEQIKTITKFFNNPNRNKESFADLRKKACDDILECDSGVWIKVFNRGGQFCQLFSSDGGSYLLNPDIHGYMGNRADFIDPLPINNLGGNNNDVVRQYSALYTDQAAYFQYGTAVSASIPVPFGKREIVYMMQNPRSDAPYGRSPIALLADIIMTLVYGSNYNLDFYMNSNMPEGIIQLLGANADEIQAFRERLDKITIVEDAATGFPRRTAFRVPITAAQAAFVPFQIDPKTMQVLEQQTWFYKIVLACFGVPINAMGIEGSEGLRTGDGDNQFKLYMRKAARPIMALMKYKIDMEILPEFGEEVFENLEFQWDDYDIDQEIKKYNLYKQQIDLQVMTPEMVAEKEGIDYTQVKAFLDQKKQENLEMARAQGISINQSFAGNNDDKEMPEDNKEKPADDPGTKSIRPENNFEKELYDEIRSKTKLITNALGELKDAASTT